MPITRGGTPATPIERMRAIGSRPWALAKSGEATSSAAAPSFSGLELPAVTVPPSWKTGGSFASRSIEVSRRGPSSASTTVSPFLPGHRDRDELVVEAPGVLGGDRLLVAVEREAVLALARDVVGGGDLLGALDVGRDLEALGRQVLGGHPQRVGVAELLHPRVRHPPSERRVEDLAVAGRLPLLGLRHHPRRPAHRLDPAGDVGAGLAEHHGPRRRRDRLEPRPAEPVDGRAGHRLGQSRQAAGSSAPRRGCPRPTGWPRRTRRPRSPRRARRSARAAPRSRRRRGRRAARSRAHRGAARRACGRRRRSRLPSARGSPARL